MKLIVGITILGSIQLLIKHNICQQKIFLFPYICRQKSKTKLKNEKPVYTLQPQIVTDLSPRTKMFSSKCNHHVQSKGSAEKLQSTSNIK